MLETRERRADIFLDRIKVKFCTTLSNEDTHDGFAKIRMRNTDNSAFQNARLAVKLTDWKIDIKPESQAIEYEDEEDWEPEEDSSMHRCRAVLSNGRRCANMALPGSLFCGIPSHQAQASEFEGLVEGSQGVTTDE